MYPNLNYHEHLSSDRGHKKRHKLYNLENTITVYCYGAAQLYSRNCSTKDAPPGADNEQLQ